MTDTCLPTLRKLCTITLPMDNDYEVGFSSSNHIIAGRQDSLMLYSFNNQADEYSYNQVWSKGAPEGFHHGCYKMICPDGRIILSTKSGDSYIYSSSLVPLSKHKLSMGLLAVTEDRLLHQMMRQRHRDKVKRNEGLKPLRLMLVAYQLQDW